MSSARTVTHRIGALLLALALVVPPGVVRADDAQCDAAFASGQKLLKQRKLLDARAQFKVCGAATCPSAKDCTEFLEQLRSLVPSVVLIARVGGKPVFDVTVSMDGVVLAKQLDGKSIEVDPGVHEFVFTSSDGKTQTAKLLVQEGKTAQEVAADFPAPPAPPPPPPPPETTVVTTGGDTKTGPSKPVDTPAKSPLGTIGLVVGGVGLVVGGVGVLVATGAKSDYEDATAKYCGAAIGGVADECSQEGLDARANARSKNRLGIGLAIGGGVLLVGGLTMWALSPSESANKTAGITRFALTPTGMLLEGKF